MGMMKAVEMMNMTEPTEVLKILSVVGMIKAMGTASVGGNQ